MKTKWTIEEIEKRRQQGRIQSYVIHGKKTEIESKPKRKRAKYNNKKVEYDGHIFGSEKEYHRYRELLLLLKAGEIGFLEMQVPFELNEGGTHSLKYVADFVYVNAKTGKRIVEDTKGYLTAVYKKKRRLMKKVYGIEILET